MSRKIEFLSTVKPILDKAGAKRDAKELAKELSEVLNGINIGTDGGGLQELKEIFNAQLVEMGKQPIVFSDNTLRGITAQFANAVSAGIKAGIAEGNNALGAFLKDKAALEDAYYNRNKNGRGSKTKVKTKLAKDIRAAFDYEPADNARGAGRNLSTIKGEYEKATDWENQYIALLKYIKAYEALERTTRDPKALQKWQTIGEYSIEQLKQSKAAIQQSLQNIFNLAYDKALVGLTPDGRVDVNVSLKVLDTIDAYDITGGKGSIEVEVKPVVKRAKKNSVPNAWRGIHKPLTAEGRNQNRESLGATYWADRTSKDLFLTGYGEDSGLEGAKNISAHLSPLNSLSIDGQKGERFLAFNQLNEVKELQYLFPGIEKFVTGADDFEQDKVQKFYNEMARQAGFDLFKTENIDEGGGEVATSLVPLQERIIEYASTLPEYYDVEKFTPEMERKIISQQKGTSERWYDQTIQRLEQQLQGAIDSDDAATEKDLSTLLPKLRQMKETAMANFDNAIASYGGYIDEEVQRGLPEVISTNDDGKLVEKFSVQNLRAKLEEYLRLSAELDKLRDIEPEKSQYADDKEYKKAKKEYASQEDAYQTEMDRVYGQLVNRLPNAIQGDIDNLLLDLIDGNTTIDDVLGHLQPHLSYKEIVPDISRAATEAERKAEANEKSADAAEREKRANDGASTRRNELTQQLDAYEGDVLDSKTADDNLAKRKEIYDLLQKEGLLTDEIQNKYDLINNRLQVRADLMRQAEEYYDDVDDLLTGQRVDSVDSAEQYRKDHIQPLDSVVDRMRDSGFFSDDELEDSFMAISRSMEERARNIAAKGVFDELDNNIIDPSAINNAEQLNKVLQERNTILSRVDDMSLIDYDQNAYVEALKHNQLIEDRIALLQKENDIEENSGVPGGASTAEVDSLRQQLDDANRRAIDAEARAQDEQDMRISTENALSNVISDQWAAEKRAQDAEEEAARLQQELSERQYTFGGISDGDTVANMTTEAAQINTLKEAVEAVTAAVNLKTQAFRDEQTTVDAVIASEIETLGMLEEKVQRIKETFETLVNNIRNGADDIGAGLSNVNITVNYPAVEQSEVDQATLDKIATLIHSVQPKSSETAITTVGDALATEKTLSSIKKTIEAINGKIVKGTKGTSSAGRRSTTKSDYQGSPFFGEKLKTREMELAKFAQQLMNNGQDTPKMQDAVKRLQDALKLVNNGANLSVWDQKFRQARLAVGIDDLKQQPDEKESIQTYKNLIAYAKEYYSIVEKYEKATDGTRRKAILGQQKQDAEAFLQNSGLNLDTLVLGDEAYNKRLSDLREKHRKNLEVIGADKQDKAIKQALADEKEEVSKLIALYKQLGQAKARQNTNLFSDEQVAQAHAEDAQLRRLIKAERAKLGTVDLDTDMKFKDAKATGYRLATTTAERAAAGKATSQRMREEAQVENEVLKEQKQIVTDLVNLYKQLGQAEAKRDMTSQNSAEVRIADKEVQSINEQIAAKRKLIKTNNELEAQFADSWMSGIESEAKKPIQDLGKEYEKLGKLQAEVEHTPDSEHLQVLKQKYATQKKLVDIESRRLQISDDLRDSYEQRTESAYQQQKLDYAEKDAKERDAARKQTQKELLKQQEKEFKKQVKASQDAAKVTKARSAMGKADDMLVSALSIEGLSDEQVAKLTAYNTQLEKLKTQYNAIRNSDGVVSEEQQKELITQTNSVNTLTQEIGELVAQYNRLSGDNATIMGASTLDSGATIDEYQKKLTDAVMAHTNGKASIKGFNAATKELSYTIQTGKYEVTEYTAAARQLDNQFVSLQGSTRQLETPMEKLKRKMSEILTYFGGSSIIYRVFGELRKGIQYVREIDSALTELKKVTDETEESYDRFLDTAAKTADKVGSTIQEVVSSTADWARLGFSMEDAAKLAESTSVLLNVSEFSSIEDATSALTSTMQAFGYVAEDSMHVVDILNEVGNNFAISSDGIATALQDSASALMAANNSYEEAVALVAAANRVVQDPNSVGSALRTISLRLRGTSVKELEEAGEDTTGAITSTSKLRSKVKSLSGVDILTDTGAYKSTYQVLLEISKVWENMSDIDQAALLEILAGKNRANTAMAILSNTTDLEEAYVSALEAEGSALKENETYLDSIQGKIDQFNNALQTMWKNTLDDEVIKGFVELGTTLIKVIDKLGVVKTLLVGLAVGAMIKGKMGPVGLFATIIELAANASTKIKEFGSYLGTLASSSQPLTKAMTDLVTSQVALQASNVATQFNEKELTQAQLARKLTTLGLTESVTTLNVAQMSQALQTANLSREQRLAVIQALGLDTATKALTATEVANALATAGVDKANQAAILSALGLSTANKGLAASFAALWTAVWPVLAVMAAGLAIWGVVKIIDKLTVTLDEQVEILQDAREEYEQSEQTLKDLNNELKTTKDRIEELQKLGTLTIAEQDELKELKAYNLELEKRLKLEQKANASKAKQQAEEAINTYEKLPATTESPKKAQEYQNRFATTPVKAYLDTEDKWNNFFDLHGQIEGSSESYLSNTYDYLKGIYDEYVASIEDDNLKLKYLGIDELQMRTMSPEERQIELAKWDEAKVRDSINALRSVLIDIESEAFTLISDETTGYQALLDNITPEYERIMAIDEHLWSDSDKAVINTYQEIQDKIKSIWQKYDPAGWFELSANEIWNDERFDDVYDKLTKLSQDGKLDEEELRKNFDDAIVNALIAACEEKGILLSDLLHDVVVNATRDTESEVKDTSITDSLSQISLLEDAFNSLGDAVKEFKEDGTASANTLEGLMETFDETEGFEELYKVLATGEGNLTESITNVANAYIAQKGILSDITDDELQIMEARLKSLGVINAQEVLQSKQVAQEKVNDALQGYTIDLSAYATAEQAKLVIAAQAGLDFSKINDENLKDLISKYKIDVDAYETAAEQKIQIAKAMAIETAKANKAEAQSALTAEWNKKGYYGSELYRSEEYNKQLRAISDEYNEAVSLANSVDATIKGIGSVLDDYYNTSFKFDFSGNQVGIGRDYNEEVDDGKTNEALEKLQKQYERQIENLDNKQTYLQNEIERLEAENKGISKSYYEEQINLEQQKLDLYAEELEALKQLERTDEVAKALWETEHAIQESTLRMVEFRKSIIDLYDTAFSDIEQAYDNKDDLFEDRQNYIDKYQQLMELQGSPEAASGYNELLAAEELQLKNNMAKLDALIAARDAAIANSDIEELSEEQLIEMEDKIRAVEEAILDNKIALEEFNQELKNLYVDAFNSIRDAFSFKDEFYSNQQSYIEGYADYLEAIGIDAPQELYDTLIEIEQKKRENAVADLVDARKGLLDIEAQGYTAADKEWQDAYNQIVALEKKIQDSDIAMAQWEKTIRDMDFEKFERFVSRLDDVNSEIEHIQNLLADEDVAFEDGTWTEEGITSLGLLYQQMQLAQQKSKEYAKEIDELNATYAEGAMSEQEYYERLQELKEGQWGAIELYEDAKDAIVDMEEARIDMIEEGINEEIEAYQELIDLKREELDAERDLYEFKKNIQNQTKDIATLERRIAAMSGSTDASTIAERTKLEAELRKAQEGLDDTYYTHAKDMQSQALDDEATSYQEAKENYLETLRDALDDTAAIIEAKISEFLLNADVGLAELNGISQEHGITLSDYLMQPWQSASEISSEFKLTADANLGSLINEDGVVTLFNTEATRMLKEVFSSAGDAAQQFNSDVTDVVGNIKAIVEDSTSDLTSGLSFPWEEVSKDKNGVIWTFSDTAESAIDGVITKAQTDFQKVLSYLSSPFTAAEDAAESFKQNAVEDLNEVITKANDAMKAIAEAKNVETSNYTGGDSGGGGGGGKQNLPKLPTKSEPSQANVKALQEVLNLVFNTKLKLDGKLGSATTDAIRKAQGIVGVSIDGIYGTATYNAIQSYIDKKIAEWQMLGGSRTVGEGVRAYQNAKKKLPVSLYAKGTLGTKQDQWAITDEPQYGDELVLIPNAAGNLSYMRKGTSVVPADITKNLMEWGQLSPNMDMSNAVQGVNVMTNVVNKPETNLSFENLLHIDNCTNEVLPEVKKIITEQLESFTKKLNYNLKRVGSKA